MRKSVLAALVVAIVVPGAVVAGRKADLRLLQRIERVDGAGSGLDADTVRGLTPQEMTGDAATVQDLGQRVAALEAKVDALTGGIARDLLYTHASRTLQAEGTERLITVDCDDPADIALNCSGGAYDGSTAFPITWMGIVLRVDDQNNPLPERCMLVVGQQATTPNLEATIRCLKLH
jgi:hypothetical protein